MWWWMPALKLFHREGTIPTHLAEDIELPCDEPAWYYNENYCAMCIFLLRWWRQALKTFHIPHSIPTYLAEEGRHWSCDEPDWCDTIIKLISTEKICGCSCGNENLSMFIVTSVRFITRSISSFFCKICGYAVLPVECLFSLPPQSQEEDAYCTRIFIVMSSWFITR